MNSGSSRLDLDTLLLTAGLLNLDVPDVYILVNDVIAERDFTTISI